MLHTAGQLCRAFLFMVVVSGLTAEGVVAAPTITSLSPTSGPVGTSVTITGTNFGSFQGPSWVGFNGASAPVTSWGNGQIVVPVPNISTGNANVVVTVGGAGSNAVSFNITPTPPATASLSPSSGPVGTSVTITGTNFGSFQGPSRVSFNGATAPVTSWSNTQIVVPVPNITSGNANVVVTVGGVASNAISFNITPVPPTITSLSTASGPVGTSVTITGTNFGSYQGPSWVGFNGSVAPVTSWSNTQIVVPVPNIASGNANVVVTVGGIASNAVSFSITPTPPVITNLSPTSGATGTNVTVTGTNFGAPQGSSTLSFNGASLVPVSWSSTQIVFSIPSGATTGNVVVTVNGLPSNGVNFRVAAAAPSITGLSPTTGSFGAPVTISGASFGATQGASTVTFNGVVATPTSWSSNGIVVPVPAGAATGSVVVQVGGAASNGIGFTVVAPPSITATVAPPPNANGWNTSVVQVSFNCSAGGLSIATCPSAQNVATEGLNLVVTGTATDVSGGSISTSVTLNIERTLPSILVSSPADQSILPSGSATIIGTVTSSLTSVTGVMCNGTVASFSAGSFACSIPLVPGVNLVMVTATDYAGNVAGTRMHIINSAALPAPSALQISPSSANLLVGGTQQFTVVDQSGQPRADAVWTVDNSNVATISTESSPTLTGVAVGIVTLTASVGGVSAQVPINVLGGTALPIGTTLWSAPAIGGSSCSRVIHAVPAVSTGIPTPALYCVVVDKNNNLVVQALTADGQQMWMQSSISTNQASATTATPDGFGGLLLDFFDSSNTFQRVDLDGQTGGVAWQYTAPPTQPWYEFAAIRADGTIVSVLNPPQGSQSGGVGTLIIQDGQTGSRIFAMPFPPLIRTVSAPSWCSYYDSVKSSPGVQPTPIVDPDGTTYLAFVSGTESIFINNCDANQPQETDNLTLSLFKVTEDASSFSIQPVKSANYAINPGPIVPDGQGGILALFFNANSFQTSVPLQVTHISSQGSSTYALPLQFFVFQDLGMVSGENGTAFATDGHALVSFDINSGNVAWSYQSAAANTLAITTSVAGNGLVAKTMGPFGAETAIRFDSTGALTTEPWTTSSLGYWAGNLWLGIPSSAPSVTGYSAEVIEFSSSDWFAQDMAGANRAVQHERVANFSQAGPNQETITNGLQKLQTLLPLFSSCNDWLQGAANFQGRSGLQQIQEELALNFFGHGAFRRARVDANGNEEDGVPDITTAAFSGTNNRDRTPVTGLPAGAAVFTVNDNGAFFNPTDGQGHAFSVGRRAYPGNTIQAQLAVLVHETAHQITVAGFQNDFGVPEAGVANDQLVDLHCRGLIDGPSITRLNPSASPVGGTITITGKNFGMPQGSSTVTFNGVAAAPTSWTDTQIVVAVPVGATTGNVVVAVGGLNGQSASRAFTVR